MRPSSPPVSGGADETVYSVHSEPFVVPHRYRVIAGESGGSQAAHVIRVALADEVADASEGMVPTAPLALKIRKFPKALDAEATDAPSRALFLRLLKLHTHIPAAFPHILPVVDVYTSPAAPGDVYCVFPATRYTLSDVARSGDISADQILYIVRYLLRCLRLLHLNMVAVTNLQPSTIAVDPDLSRPDAVLISDLTRCIAVPASGKRPVVLGDPALANAAGPASPNASANFKHKSGAAKAKDKEKDTAAAAAGTQAAGAAAGTTASGKDKEAKDGQQAVHVTQFEARHSDDLTDDAAAVHAAADRFLLPRGLNVGMVPPHLIATSTLSYLAPEVALGGAASGDDAPPSPSAGKRVVVTSAADMWSLGVIVFELATKQRLFPAADREEYVGMLADVFGGVDVDYVGWLGDTPWVRRLAAVARNRTGATLAGRLAGVDQRLRFLIARLLRVNPKERPPAHELVKLPHFGGNDVPLGHFVGPLPTGGGGGGTGKTATSAQRAAEAAAAAAAATAPVVLGDSEYIHEGWNVPIDASEQRLAAEADHLLRAVGDSASPV